MHATAPPAWAAIFRPPREYWRQQEKLTQPPTATNHLLSQSLEIKTIGTFTPLLLHEYSSYLAALRFTPADEDRPVNLRFARFEATVFWAGIRRRANDSLSATARFLVMVRPRLLG